METRSAKGRYLDFAVLTQQNGLEPAIGNAGINARGDIIGRGGVVITTAEEIKGEYNKNRTFAAKTVALSNLEDEILLSPAEAVAEAIAAQKGEKVEKPAPKSRKIVDSDK
jgi:hypothetical protein